MRKFLSPYLLLISISGVIMIMDQISKALIHAKMKLHQSIEVIPGFFDLTYIRNPGAAFGLFASSGGYLKTLFFIGISLVALVILIHLYRKTPREYLSLRLALSLVTGGAIGNLIDRIRIGEVVDFLDFYIGAYHWPAFNVADSSITVGVSLLVYHTFFHRIEDPEISANS